MQPGAAMVRSWVGTVAVALALGAPACNGDRGTPSVPEPGSPEADRLLDGIRARLPVSDLLAPPAGSPATLRRLGKDLQPRFGGDGAETGAGVSLPDTADGAFRLEDPTSRLAIRVSLPGSRAVAARVAAGDGLVVYPGAHGSGADVIQRPRTDGVEDFLFFERRPARPTIDYRLELERGVRGLRLVADTLELLDEGGAPRLRVSQPYLVGADGRRVAGTLAVEGCALDRSAAPPWRRAPVTPGASHCLLRVSWPASVPYPALLDPGWSFGSSMAYGRSSPATLVLLDGRVLAAGGLGGPGATRDTAEIYDPATGTWALTGLMSMPRSRIQAQRLPDGRVVAAGGSTTDGVRVARTEIFDPATGLWSVAGDMSVPRGDHVSALLADGRVLVAGGSGSTIHRTAELFDASTGLWSAAPSMTHTRVWATGTALPDGRVLVAGGQGSGGATGELFDPAANGGAGAWTLVPGTMAVFVREDHAATLLPNGRVLLTGGLDSNGSQVATTALFDPATTGWLPSPNMITARRQHKAVLLPSGRVLIPGGSQLAAPTAVELYDPATGTFTATSPLNNPRHTFGLAVAGGRALLVGGNWSSTWYTTVEIYEEAAAPGGATCRVAGDCASGFCADGYCCDTACAGPCDRCHLPGTLGTCTPADDRGTIGPQVNACIPYLCNGSGASCPTSCATNSDCTSGAYCGGGQCLPRWPVGTPCQPGDPCTASCQDGVCCNSSCSGPCDRCNVPGDVGRCRIEPLGAPGSPSCSPTTCTGYTNACATGCGGPDGAPCAADAYCITSSGLCAPKKPNGQACTAANVCLSGFCVDGKCCDGACAGQCEACNAAGSCQPVIGAPVGGRAPCATDGSACGGACDGSSGSQCRYPGGETICRAPSCAGGVALAAASCAGAGACPASVATACAPYLCGANACQSTCASDADCTGDHHCSSSVCLPRQAQGTACTAANQCQSGFCADGFCCDTACGGGNAGDCQACAAALGAAADGTCGVSAAGRSCRAAAGPCDVGETCDGASSACPADGFVTAGAICRSAAGDCDAAETCSGSSAACPADGLSPAGTTCRAAAGPCDAPEACSGSSLTCPADARRPSGFVCRPAATVCDRAETCNGTAITCPADGFLADGTGCNDGNACTRKDACTAGVCQGRPIGGCP